MAKKECNCKWSFADLPGNQLGQGAQNAIISHFDKSPYSSLIRESIQNSLDAPDDSGNPVIVEYTFSRIQASEYPCFFELQNHIRGIADSFPYNDAAIKMSERMSETFQQHMSNQRIPFIRVSDYNTTGMRFRKKGQGKSPFTSFLRIAGDSLKNNAGSGGSFGFGKAAYFNISPIRTVLVSTLTKDNEYFFEGGAMLTDHMYKGVEKTFFGFYDDKDGFEPTSNPADIPERFRRERIGTDFFIMGVNATDLEKEKAKQEMVEATLRNFWLAIYHKRLVVKIEEIEINKETLQPLINLYFPSERDDKNRSEKYNPRPYFEAVKNEGTSSSYVHIRKSIPILGEVSLYIKKVKDAKDKIAYMRSPRMLVYSKQNQTSYGCYCLFFCDNQLGNELLRNLENAAHREWEPSNYKDNITLGKEAIKSISSFISESLEELFNTQDDTPLGISGLEEFLYLEDDMIPTENEDVNENPFFGIPSGEFDKEGTSMTSIIKPITPKTVNKQGEKTGKVVALKKTKAKSDPKGNLGGNDKHPASGKHNERSAPGNKPKIETEEVEPEGTYSEFIPVNYRVIANRTLQGEMNHTIIIYAPHIIEDGMLELLIAGEQDTEALDITYSDNGDFNDNKVFGLQFSEGKNEVTVRFDDNMKHPIILKAYEFK